MQDTSATPSPVSAPAEAASSAATPAVAPTAAVTVFGVPPTQGEVITSETTGNSYTMGEKIGEGNFGLVYSCVDGWENKLAAKVLKPLAPYEKVKSSAQAELGKLYQLRHPYITYDACNDWAVAVRSRREIWGNIGTDGKFSHVSLRTNQKLQETFRVSPSFLSKKTGAPPTEIVRRALREYLKRAK
jgi:hypothetical protein